MQIPEFLQSALGLRERELSLETKSNRDGIMQPHDEPFGTARWFSAPQLEAA
jgi:hypothetical protein